ncbi:MAG: family 10 glycosylhydrolase, partial [Clostridia bacterium]
MKGKSEGEFRTNIKKAFSNITDLGMNTVIVQVRPFSDALYYSDIFPISHIVTGTEGVDPGFDPLKIMVD